MKKCVFIFGILFLVSFFGPIKLTANALNGPLRVHPDNPRYFTDGNGEAIYLTSAYAGNILQDQGNISKVVFTDHVNYLKAHKINLAKFVIRDRTQNNGVVSPSIYARTGPGLASDGNLKFDLNQFNPEFINRLRSRISYLENNGIYVVVMFFNGLDVRFSSGWANSAYNRNNNINGIDGDTNGDGVGNEVQTWPLSSAIEQIERARIRKIIDEVNEFDNVIYEVCNEAYEGSEDWQYWVINEIRKYQATKPKQHPIGMTVESPGGDNQEIFSSNADWVSPDFYRTNPPAADGSKIIISDSDHWHPLQMTSNQVWEAFTRGLHPMSIERTSATDWSLNLFEVHDNMKYTQDYANKMNLKDITPRNTLSSTTYCLANPGQEYLVYQPGSGSFTVNLSANTYDYEWFNPNTGQVAKTGTITVGNGNRSFTPPFSGKAVLYISALGSRRYTDICCDHSSTGKCVCFFTWCGGFNNRMSVKNRPIVQYVSSTANCFAADNFVDICY
jgi:hypothetical protein